MAWPDDDSLPVVVEAAFGADLAADPGTWSWTDLSDRLTGTVQTRTGRSPGASTVSPGTATVTLINDDAAVTPLHAMSPYWPHVVLGVPVRIRLDWDGILYDLLGGFADSWTPVYVPTTDGTMHAAMRVTVSGVLRRLEQGDPPVLSPLRRRIAAQDGLLAYWPMEDEADAGRAASAVPGGAPMAPTGDLTFAAGQVDISAGATFRYGTKPLPDFTDGGGLTGRVLPGASSPIAWSVQWFHQTGSGSDDDFVIMRWTTTSGGTYVRWDLVQDRGGVDGTYLVGYDSAGAASVLWSDGVTFAGPADLVVSAVQNGALIDITVRFGTYSDTASVAGTLTHIDQVSVNPDGYDLSVDDGLVLGHLRVYDHADAEPLSLLELRADWGEAAHTRMARLAAEDGLAMTIPAVDPGDETLMGSQPDGTLLELLRECEDADGGVLYESGYGLGYLPRTARYNPPPSLTIDLSTYATSEGSPDPLRPTYDDQGVRNEWTVSRPGGSAATVADLEHQAAHGVRRDAVELNLPDDTTLADQAGWRVRRGTVDRMREQTAPIDLAANPTLVDAWLACGIGSRIVRTGAPAQHPPGDIDVLAVGWSQVIGPRRWMVQVTPEPTVPWLVAEADGDQRAPADGSTLAVGVDADDLTLSLASTAANGVWVEGDTISNPTDFPQDLRIGGASGVGGERVTCTGITGSTSPQTVTLSARGVNGVTRAWDAGTSVDVWDPTIAPL